MVAAFVLVQALPDQLTLTTRQWGMLVEEESATMACSTPTRCVFCGGAPREPDEQPLFPAFVCTSCGARDLASLRASLRTRTKELADDLLCIDSPPTGRELRRLRE